MIWTVYAALLALLFVALSIRTLRLRRRLRIAVGDGGNATMLRAIRVHANCAEYTPLGVLLVLGCELSGAPVFLIHGLGLALLGGRVVHAYGLASDNEVFRYRVSGMALTFTCYIVAAGFLLAQAVVRHR